MTLTTLIEITRRLGLKQTATRNWVSARWFPMPVGNRGAAHLYDFDAVKEAYEAEQKRIAGNKGKRHDKPIKPTDEHVYHTITRK